MNFVRAWKSWIRFSKKLGRATNVVTCRGFRRSSILADGLVGATVGSGVAILRKLWISAAREYTLICIGLGLEQSWRSRAISKTAGQDRLLRGSVVVCLLGMLGDAQCSRIRPKLQAISRTGFRPWRFICGFENPTCPMTGEISMVPWGLRRDTTTDTRLIKKKRGLEPSGRLTTVATQCISTLWYSQYTLLAYRTSIGMQLISTGASSLISADSLVVARGSDNHVTTISLEVFNVLQIRMHICASPFAQHCKHDFDNLLVSGVQRLLRTDFE